MRFNFKVLRSNHCAWSGGGAPSSALGADYFAPAALNCCHRNNQIRGHRNLSDFPVALRSRSCCVRCLDPAWWPKTDPRCNVMAEVMACYMMKKYAWGLRKTMEFLSSRRPGACADNFESRPEIACHVLPDLELKPSFLQQLLSFERPLGSIESCGRQNCVLQIAPDASEAIGQPVQTILQSWAKFFVALAASLAFALAAGMLECAAIAIDSPGSDWSDCNLSSWECEDMCHELSNLGVAAVRKELLLRNTYINSQMGPLAEIQPAPQELWRKC